MRFKLKYQVNKALGIQYIGNPVTCFRLLNETTESGNQKQSYVCTINRWDTELSEQVALLLTKVEIKEWKAWKKAHDARFRKKQLSASLETVSLTLRYAATALAENSSTVDDTQKAAIWSAMSAFTSAMANSGLSQPSRTRSRQSTQELPPPEVGLPVMSNLDQLGSPLESAYRSLAERYKALQALCKRSKYEHEVD